MRLTGCVRMVAVVVLAMLAGGYAYADTDHQCLKLCVEGGRSTNECLKGCSYDAPGTKPKMDKKDSSKDTSTVGTAHRVLPTLKPGSESTIMLDSKAVSPYRQQKDYSCMATCLKNNIQYQVCANSCTTVTDKTGHVLVSPAYKGNNSSQSSSLSGAHN